MRTISPKYTMTKIFKSLIWNYTVKNSGGTFKKVPPNPDLYALEEVNAFVIF